VVVHSTQGVRAVDNDLRLVAATHEPGRHATPEDAIRD
jgi:hypothetical protein